MYIYLFIYLFIYILFVTKCINLLYRSLYDNTKIIIDVQSKLLENNLYLVPFSANGINGFTLSVQQCALIVAYYYASAAAACSPKHIV